MKRWFGWALVVTGILAAPASRADLWQETFERGWQARLANEFEVAETHFRDALDLVDIGDPTDSRLHTTMTALAVVLERQDRGEEIGPLFHDAAEIDSEALLDDQKTVAFWVGLHASRLRQRSDDRTAVAMVRKALPAYERVYGADSVEVARILDSLSDALFQHGSIEERIGLQERRLSIYEEEFGADAYELFDPLSSLADVLFWTDRDRTERLRLRAYQITRQHHADDPQKMSMACFALEAYYLSVRDQESARLWGDRSREFKARVDTPDGPQTRRELAAGLMSEASMLERDGRVDEVEAKVREAVDHARAAHGPGPELCRLLGRAAGFLERRDDYRGAEAYLLEAKRHAESLGDEHPGPLRGVMRSFATHYRKRLRYAKAIDHSIAARDLARRLTLPELAADLNLLADLYVEVGKYGKALAELNESLRVHEEFYGKDSRMTMNPLYRLADLHTAMGNGREAETYLVRTIELLEATSGPDNPFLISSKDKLRALRGDRR